jgi:hypothetical protein
LAGPGFSQQQNADIGGGHLLDLGQRPSKRFALADDFLEPQRINDFLFEVMIFLLKALGESLYFLKSRS